MKYERFINGLKSGGITIAIIYSIPIICLDIIDNIISSKNINSSSGILGKLVLFTIIPLVICLICNAGLYGSSNDIIEGKLTSFSTFLQNGKRYFLRTLGYTFLYAFAFLIPFILAIFILNNSSLSSSLSNSLNNSLSNNSVILTLLATFVFQAIFIPLIILNVIDKDSKGYIKKNYVSMLIFSLIACALNLIPIAGKFFLTILNGFYPLFIISMCDNIKPIDYNKPTIQGINNNDLLK
jgi:hypothetical protein